MTETWLRPAPKHLAMLAQEMRADWPYEETRAALIACHNAGMDDPQLYRETFRLLLIKDSAPGDLRHLAKAHRPGGGLPQREDAVALLAAYRAKVAGQAADDDGGPEGGEQAS